MAVVRVSGSGAAHVVRAVCGRVPSSRGVTLVQLRDARGVFDEGLLTWMPAPRSYTGEDLAEISCHGNPLLVERLLEALCGAGSRLAERGEFTRRAFLNGRMDLTRAEAVLQTINATSGRGLAIARAGIEGAVADAVAELRRALVDRAAELESELDYPGEGFVLDSSFDVALRTLGQRAAQLAAGQRSGQVAIEGARVVLIGPVNAGKSSLFNALLGRDRALVSATPGTTRDVVEAPLQLAEVRLVLCDTAGTRESDDPIERAGQVAAADAGVHADLLLLVFPGHLPLGREGQELLDASRDRERLVVLTHGDLDSGHAHVPGALRVSARTGQGIDALRTALVGAICAEEPGAVSGIVSTQRQRASLLEFARLVGAAADALLGGAGAAIAVEQLYSALRTVDGVLGVDTREEVLDRLFARFCIGK